MVIFETIFCEIFSRTHNVKSFRFPKPKNFESKAGQFIFVTINTVKGELRKHFTLSSSPSENHLELTKKLTGSDFSKALQNIKIGDWVKIEGPYGTFFLDPKYNKIAMLTGGIGITPFRSMLKCYTDNNLNNDVTLIYSNSYERDIIFKDEFDKIIQQNNNLKIFYTLTSPSPNWVGETGRIDKYLIKNLIPDYLERLFYLCGPPNMVQTINGVLKSIGIPDEMIRKEAFPGY